jgi:hypothetical protein
MWDLSLANNTCDAHSSAESRPLRNKVSTIPHPHSHTHDFVANQGFIIQ